MTYDVEVNNLSLHYKDFEALNGITFKLESGKIYGLLGRNGAGKTSLLSLLASFREATSGSIKIGGENPFENANIMQHVVFLYKTDYKEETETVKGMLENVKRHRPYYDENYAMYLADRFKLPLDKPANKLSKGMQSALEVTMGLSSRAPVTIFDESYLGMDAPTRETFYQELLKDQADHPRTIILSTHLVSEMDHLFDEVVIIDKGSILLQENYETLISKGTSITGAADDVTQFISNMTYMNEQQLGATKSVMVFDQLTDENIKEAKRRGMDIGPVTLQDLFIHLTDEEA